LGQKGALGSGDEENDITSALGCLREEGLPLPEGDGEAKVLSPEVAA
jgi:hypothetical protein